MLNDLIQYGPFYLNTKEYKMLLKKRLNDYYQFLGVNMFGSRGSEFWNYHRGRLEELGHPVTTPKLFKGVFIKLLREAINPGQAVGEDFQVFFLKIFPRCRRRPATVEKVRTAEVELRE